MCILMYYKAGCITSMYDWHCYFKVYRFCTTRYSGHLESRLMRFWAQQDQTSRFSYCMRGKRKEEVSWLVVKCISTCLSLLATHSFNTNARASVLECVCYCDVYKFCTTRYSGHLESRLMRFWAQQDQTSRFSYCMRGKRKEEVSWLVVKCISTCLSLLATIHTEVETAWESSCGHS